MRKKVSQLTPTPPPPPSSSFSHYRNWIRHCLCPSENRIGGGVFAWLYNALDSFADCVEYASLVLREQASALLVDVVVLNLVFQISDDTNLFDNIVSRLDNSPLGGLVSGSLAEDCDGPLNLALTVVFFKAA